MTDTRSPLPPPDVPEPDATNVADSPSADTAAPDEPPRRTRRRRRTTATGAGQDKSPRAPRARRRRSHAVEVTQLHVLVGGGLQLVPVPAARAAGGGLVEVAPQAGPYWDRVAAEYPAVAAFLDSLTHATLIGEGLTIYAPVILAVLAAARSGGQDAPPDPLLSVLASMVQSDRDSTSRGTA